MTVTDKINTIKTDKFNNFMWKRIPIDHDYITIVFCVSEYKNTSENFFDNLTNDNIKRALKYVLNVMPLKCVVNVQTYEQFIDEFNNIEKDTLLEKNIDILEKKINMKENDVNYLKKKVNNLNNKKTYIFNYSDDKSDDTVYLETKKICDISINNHFHETHKVCIGRIDNIPKNILSISDYIFFENREVLNKYLESYNHNMRINSNNTYNGMYVIDKCNYEYYHLFSFNKYNM